MPNQKRFKEPIKEEFITKHNSPPKMNSNVVRSAWQLQQKTSLHVTYCCSSAPTKESLRSSQAPITWYKNCKGEFIIKDQQTPKDND